MANLLLSELAAEPGALLSSSYLVLLLGSSSDLPPFCPLQLHKSNMFFTKAVLSIALWVLKRSRFPHYPNALLEMLYKSLILQRAHSHLLSLHSFQTGET